MPLEMAIRGQSLVAASGRFFLAANTPAQSMAASIEGATSDGCLATHPVHDETNAWSTGPRLVRPGTVSRAKALTGRLAPIPD
jgi:hypothetical protein